MKKPVAKNKRLVDDKYSVKQLLDLDRLRDIFENSPVALIEADLSYLKKSIDRLKKDDAGDLKNYFDRHPKFLKKLISNIKILDINAQTVGLCRAASKENFKSGFGSIFSAEMADKFKLDLQALAAGKFFFEYESTICAMNGDMLTVVIRRTVPKAYEKDWSRVLVAITDITERKRLMGMKDEFINTVSHELRTPLNALRESISLVLEGRVGALNEKQQTVLYIGRRNADRLTRLIQQVLDIQKIQSGAMKPHFEENDINHAIEEVRLSMASLISRNGLTFSARLDEDLPRFSFDRDRIIEVLLNLVDNAVRHTRKGGIVVRTRRNGQFVHISVSDTGCGIDQKDMPRLFRWFSQLERRAGGAGLGLAISKETIEGHNGRIWAESKLGKGTTFHIMLPLQP